MKKFFALLFLVIALFTYTNRTNAQELDETLSNLSSTAGKAYVAPIITAFGSNLNSGWVSKLPPATKIGFHFDLKIIAMGSLFDDDMQRFATDGTFFFTASQIDEILQYSGYRPTDPGYSDIKKEIQRTQFSVRFSGPTIIGSENEYLKVHFPAKKIKSGAYEYNLNSYDLEIREVKGILNKLKIFPTAAVQLTVGTVAGTNVAFRYFPSYDIEDVGKLTFFGFGAIHNPGAWFPNPLPVELGIGYFYQKLEVGDIFESTAAQFGLYVSKTFGLGISITPYAGYTMETSETKVKYDYRSNEVVNGVPVPPTKISFELEGENKSAFTVGFNLKLGFFNLFGDYKLAKTKTVSAGLSLGL